MINEYLKKENTFLDDWAAKVSGFIRDGIVDHEFYWKSGIKILFLLNMKTRSLVVPPYADLDEKVLMQASLQYTPLFKPAHG